MSRSTAPSGSSGLEYTADRHADGTSLASISRGSSGLTFTFRSRNTPSTMRNAFTTRCRPATHSRSVARRAALISFTCISSANRSSASSIADASR